MSSKRAERITNDFEEKPTPPSSKPINNALKLKLDHLKTFEPLTDNQRKFYDAYKRGDYFVALHGVAGTGKAQPLDSKILTPDGWKMMGQMKVGDIITAADGKAARVDGVFPQGEKDIYTITFHDGSSTRCCGEHLWEVWFGKYVGSKSSKHIIDTHKIKEIIDSGINVSIPVLEPSQTPDVILPLDPYLLGVFLGDGCIGPSALITSADIHIIEQIQSLLLPNHRLSDGPISPYDYKIVTDNREECKTDEQSNRINQYHEIFRELGLWMSRSNNKFIPSIYKTASTNQKLQLIRGLMDTDGTTSSNPNRAGLSFTTVSEQLAKDLQEMLWSIGALCTIASRIPTFTYKGIKKDGQRCYTLHIAYRQPQELFTLERKRRLACEKHGNGRIELRRRVSSIELTSHEPAQCISIDHPDHLYITDDYIVTHNTFVALYKAIEEVLDRSNPFNKIIVVRSAVQSREMGHLPGDINDKMDIFQQPYRQICHTLFERKDAYDRLEEQGHIEFISTSFIRGMSFDDAIIIVDECQNMNWSEISTVMTRVGYRSKIIWCGDYRQTDLNKSKNDVSGIKQFLTVASTVKAFTLIEFTVDDIVRSSLVRDWIVACNNLGIDT